MNLLKKIFITSGAIIAFHSAFGYICVNTTSNYKMFGSVLRANILKNPFLMAFQDEHFKEYKIFHAGNDNGLVEQVNEMAHEDCSIILGLFTSHDCLISGQTLKQNKIVSLSSSCSDDQISNFFPYVHTASPKLSDYSKRVATYINNSSASNVIAFYQPSDVYSDSGFKAFKKYVKKNVIEIQVSSGDIFSAKNLTKLLHEPSAIVFFTYPLPSAQILVSLDAEHFIADNVSIIGASSWIFDVSVFKPIRSILIKAKNVLTPSLVSQKEINSSSFANKFFELYNREPDIVEVLTYDTTRMAVRCYRKILQNGEYNNDAFLDCIKHNNYIGISGDFKFERSSPFSIRKIHIINFLERI